MVPAKDLERPLRRLGLGLGLGLAQRSRQLRLARRAVVLLLRRRWPRRDALEDRGQRHHICAGRCVAVALLLRTPVLRVLLGVGVPLRDVGLLQDNARRVAPVLVPLPRPRLGREGRHGRRSAPRRRRNGLARTVGKRLQPAAGGGPGALSAQTGGVAPRAPLARSAAAVVFTVPETVCEG